MCLYCSFVASPLSLGKVNTNVRKRTLSGELRERSLLNSTVSNSPIVGKTLSDLTYLAYPPMLNNSMKNYPETANFGHPDLT